MSWWSRKSATNDRTAAEGNEEEKAAIRRRFADIEARLLILEKQAGVPQPEGGK